MKIPLIKPYITESIKQRVCDVLDSGYLTEGPVTREFENKLKEYIGCDYLHAVTSATTGLEVALRALGIGPGDEVIVPDYTYPATASVIAIVGAKAIIVDVSKEDMLMNLDALEAAISKKTKAIIPVSLFGAPLDYDRLNQIKIKHKLFIVEDAACSIGAVYQGIKVGNQADITVFSLHPRKFITTGEGGIITTNNKKWADWINSYKHFGMEMSGANREGIHFNIIGTNYKLSNIQAAVGLGQLENIEKLLSKRILLANNYKKLIKKIDKIRLPKVLNPKPNCQHSFQTYVVYVEDRDIVMRKMRTAGIEVQIGSYSLHMHKAFNDNPQIKIKGKMQNSRWCYEHALALPLYDDLTEELQKNIIEELKNIL
ncbi:DegT/DnrJ/EryC1/StrS aminotransferase family protein [Cyclobacteriaceae bacterium]|nr:DegT/DnrJ/EryC1/StrS aminotransferase family protein [Cyclobacteriaceae bacterium]